MINADMRSYNYFTFGDDNGYGSPTLSSEVKGTIKMAIHTTSQSVQDNIMYQGATYIGLTHDNIDNSFVIALGDERLKVLYVQPKGRFKQVFMEKMA